MIATFAICIGISIISLLKVTRKLGFFSFMAIWLPIWILQLSMIKISLYLTNLLNFKFGFATSFLLIALSWFGLTAFFKNSSLHEFRLIRSKADRWQLVQILIFGIVYAIFNFYTFNFIDLSSVDLKNHLNLIASYLTIPQPLFTHYFFNPENYEIVQGIFYPNSTNIVGAFFLYFSGSSALNVYALSTIFLGFFCWPILLFIFLKSYNPKFDTSLLPIFIVFFNLFPMSLIENNHFSLLFAFILLTSILIFFNTLYNNYTYLLGLFILVSSVLLFFAHPITVLVFALYMLFFDFSHSRRISFNKIVALIFGLFGSFLVISVLFVNKSVVSYFTILQRINTNFNFPNSSALFFSSINPYFLSMNYNLIIPLFPLFFLIYIYKQYGIDKFPIYLYLLYLFLTISSFFSELNYPLKALSLASFFFYGSATRITFIGILAFSLIFFSLFTFREELIGTHVLRYILRLFIILLVTLSSVFMYT